MMKRKYERRVKRKYRTGALLYEVWFGDPADENVFNVFEAVICESAISCYTQINIF